MRSTRRWLIVAPLTALVIACSGDLPNATFDTVSFLDSAGDAGPPPDDAPKPADTGPDAASPGDSQAPDGPPPDGTPTTTPCVFDSRAVIIDGKDHRIESIAAYGRFYNFDSDDAYKAWPNNGDDLTSVPRYAAGPCAGQAAGKCVFDSRTVIIDDKDHRIESITAYGKFYNFDSDDAYKAWPDNGKRLGTVSRYAAICP